MKTILSIDGGGVRGVIPATILSELERRTGKRTAELFDLMAGSSAGGILTVLYNAPDAGAGRPRYSAAAGIELYLENQDKIFDSSLWRNIKTLAGLTDEKYDGDTLEGLFRKYVGGATLADACTRMLVSTYDLESRHPFFFKSWKPEQAEVLLAEIARATSAAPTYFAPKQITVGGTLRSLVDGGVFANNMGMCAYAAAHRLWPGEELTIVSLGTGENARPIPYDAAKDWGLAEWAVPILKVVFDGVDNAVNYQLRLLMDRGYYRFQRVLTDASERLDDTSTENIRALEGEARKILADQAAEFDEVCELLAAHSA